MTDAIQLPVCAWWSWIDNNRQYVIIMSIYYCMAAMTVLGIVKLGGKSGSYFLLVFGVMTAFLTLSAMLRAHVLSVNRELQASN